MGGTCTGEHGIGRGKIQLLGKQFDNEAIESMKRIKYAFDPKNLMNPNKIFQ
jgi:D-lactate dehydrogenase (cytochrome)